MLPVAASGSDGAGGKLLGTGEQAASATIDASAIPAGRAARRPGAGETVSLSGRSMEKACSVMCLNLCGMVSEVSGVPWKAASPGRSLRSRRAALGR